MDLLDNCHPPLIEVAVARVILLTLLYTRSMMGIIMDITALITTSTASTHTRRVLRSDLLLDRLLLVELLRQSCRLVCITMEATL